MGIEELRKALKPFAKHFQTGLANRLDNVAQRHRFLKNFLSKLGEAGKTFKDEAPSEPSKIGSHIIIQSSVVVGIGAATWFVKDYLKKQEFLKYEEMVKVKTQEAVQLLREDMKEWQKKREKENETMNLLLEKIEASTVDSKGNEEKSSRQQ